MPIKKAKSTVLVVDDEPDILNLMTRLLESFGYAFITARSGPEALEKTAACRPDLILLDVKMPGMDGYEVCKRLKEREETQHIPVVMVTGLADRESRIMGLEAGANDFLSKPFDNSEFMIRTQNLLKVKKYEDLIQEYNADLENEVRKKTQKLHDLIDELVLAQVRLKENYLDTIYRLTLVSEYKDPDTSNHIRRVGQYCAHIANELGWSQEDIMTIKYAAPMHDIGKVVIPNEVLQKPGQLTHEEHLLMKTHTQIGARILRESSSSLLQMAERIALSHHERWNGTGYPRGLKQEEIPVEGQIMNLADQYDALRSKRPYKPMFDHQTACAVILEGDERTLPDHFAPGILKIFEKTNEAFSEIYESL